MRVSPDLPGVAQQHFTGARTHGHWQAHDVPAWLLHDLNFRDHLPRLFAHKPDARSTYDGKPDFSATAALRNSSLQGRYQILA